MIVFAEIPHAPSFDFNGQAPPIVGKAEYLGRQTPTRENFQEFVFD
jgi:hypothetical protein